ncbi:WD40 repeat domain-containing protein [Streptomyces sp. N2-109]|uniref:WD40 repeat domain-containing protein n=1 Tax=Streptomyces gossypii TaxID=2883101 RepID=A0ABT2JXX2_9ACTN|nr:WD40 repeat domain-containing protein [Streptomyces gossypii]MCT2592748.1 WD40 repeat domain-containing protein [Streptomyces gossypii]
MSLIETVLSMPGGAKPRFYRVALDGRTLVRAAWAQGGRPRETVKELEVSDDREALLAFEKARDKKLREGFARVADPSGAARGDVVLEMIVPNRSWCPGAFDLSPDGRTLVVATMLKDGYGAEIHLVDVAGGGRRLVHAEPPEVRPAPRGRGQTFPHTVLFDADGRRIVYALNGETRLLDLARGQGRTLAAYRESADADFNPHRVHPKWDGSRRRLLAYDSGNRVRVLDRQGHIVFEVHADGPYACWDGALSPSGRLLALSRSRGRTYGGSEPMTTEIEVWDTEAGTIRQRIPVPGRQPAKDIGFDPSETLVLAAPWGSGGPGAYSVDTAELVWHFADPHRPERWAACYGWAYSPDGKTLALGRRGELEVVDTATRTADPVFGSDHRPETGTTGRTYGVRFSADGTLVASGGDSGRIVVRKL